MPKQAKTKTVSINLRLPADLHKALVKAGTSGSPPRSLNSEILSRLHDSFEVAALTKEVRAQIEYLEKEGMARVEEVERRAHETVQRLESTRAEVDELQRLVKAKLK
jgi:hypothetical protein